MYLLLVLGLFLVSKIAASDGVDLASTKKEVQSPHKIKLLDSGIQSYQARLELIRRAKKTIELEFFIFDLDDSARLLMHELIDRAKSGVKVRLLVDFSQPIFKLSPAYAKYLREQGVDIRYYNTAPLYRFASVQHRSHRKILIADGREAIIGGRNIADEYFDMDSEYNFTDSDIWIEGEVVPFIREGFDQYFNAELTSSPDTESVDKEAYSRILDFFKNREQSQMILDKLTNVQFAPKEYSCNDVIFVTDPPSGSSDHRQIFPTLVELSKEVKERVDIESPYFVLGKGGYDFFQSLKDRKVQVNVLTNSLYSTDAKYVVSSLVYKLFSIKRLNINLWVFNGDPVKGQSSEDYHLAHARWGIHAKRMVVDNKHVLIGSYNIDPRSANLNSEMILICKNNPEFAQGVFSSIQLRKNQSVRVISGGRLDSFAGITQKSSTGDILSMYSLIPLTSLFEFLL